MSKNSFSRPLVLTFSFLLLCLVAVSAQQDPQQSAENKSGQEVKSSPAPAAQTPAQQPPSRPSNPLGNDQERIKIGTELVSLTVTVTDPYNRLVTGLDKHNFEIFEDKVKQEISHFSDDDVPVSLGIIFDVSGSMKGKLDRARDALRAFIQTSHSDDD